VRREKDSHSHKEGKDKHKDREKSSKKSDRKEKDKKSKKDKGSRREREQGEQHEPTTTQLGNFHENSNSSQGDFHSSSYKQYRENKERSSNTTTARAAPPRDPRDRLQVQQQQQFEQQEDFGSPRKYNTGMVQNANGLYPPHDSFQNHPYRERGSGGGDPRRSHNKSHHNYDRADRVAGGVGGGNSGARPWNADNNRYVINKGDI
jgi:hypothetical protein